MPIKWKWGRGIPNNLGRKQTRRAFGSAHKTWATLRSNCSNSVRSYVRYRYKGRARRSPGRDGVNLVDFGRLGSSAIGVTYTWFQNGRMLESDLRLNSEYRWTNRRRGRGFRVANVAVHELGHQLGLGHVGNGHGALSMYSVTYPGETKKMTLGRGDLRGIASIYGR